jgi:hypothetical protein
MASPPELVAQSRPGFALQYGQRRVIGLVGNDTEIVILFFAMFLGTLRLMRRRIICPKA